MNRRQEMTDRPTSTRFLGKGSMGCVFQPSLPCAHPKPIPGATEPALEASNPVAKTFFKQKRAREELDAAVILARVDPLQQWFIYPYAHCNITASALKKFDREGACLREMATANKKAKSRIPQHIMSYGGPRIDAHLRQALEAENKRTPLKGMIGMVRHLLEGLQRLYKAGYVHQDLKTYNIVIQNNVPHMIDFSLLLSTDKVFSEKNANRLRFEYFPYPMEFKVAYVALKNGFDKKAKDKDKVNANANNAKAKAQDTLTWGATHIDDVLQRTLRTLRSFGTPASVNYLKMFSTQDIMREVMDVCMRLERTKGKLPCKQWAAKLDSYGLGMTVVDLYNYIDFQSAPPPLVEAWTAFMKGLVHPNPWHRLTIDQACREARLLEALAQRVAK